MIEKVRMKKIVRKREIAYYVIEIEKHKINYNTISFTIIEVQNLLFAGNYCKDFHLRKFYCTPLFRHFAKIEQKSNEESSIINVVFNE
jgi:hypothetical protein